MFDVHPFFEQPFFQVICLFLHLSSYSRFDVGRSMFDVHPFFEQPFFQVICLFLHVSFYSRFDVGRSMFDVHPFSCSRAFPPDT